MAKPPTKSFELRPLRILVLVVLLLALCIMALSRWQVVRRPIALAGPIDLSVAYQKLVYFDSIEYFDLDRDFYFTRQIGDSFAAPKRVGGDLLCGVGTDDSLLLVFRSSFSIYTPTEDKQDLEWTFAGRLPQTWPIFAILPHRDHFRGMGYKKSATQGGELRVCLLEGREFREHPSYIEVSDRLEHVTAGSLGDTSFVVYTSQAPNGTSATWLTRWTPEAGFTKPEKLPFVADAQALVTVPGADLGRSILAKVRLGALSDILAALPVPERLLLLCTAKDAKPGEILRYAWQGGKFERLSVVSEGESGWLAGHEAVDLAACSTREGVFVVLVGEDIGWGVVGPDGKVVKRFRPLIDPSGLTSLSTEVWNLVVPLVLIMTIFLLFGRQRGPSPIGDPTRPQKPRTEPELEETDPEVDEVEAPEEDGDVSPRDERKEGPGTRTADAD